MTPKNFNRNFKNRRHQNNPVEIKFYHTLPADTQMIEGLKLKGTQDRRNVQIKLPHAIENFYLLYNKFGMPILEKRYDIKQRQKILQEVKHKLDFIKEVAKRGIDEYQTRFINTGWQKNIEPRKEFSVRLNGRMVVGLGATNVYEIGMTLDFLTGIPYIPGSALKGATRAAFVIKWAEYLNDDNIDLECLDNIIDKFDYRAWKESGDSIKYLAGISTLRSKSEKRYLPVEVITKIEGEIAENWQNSYLHLVQDIFGAQKASGKVIFLDAYPEGKIKFDADVMNSHYSEYYRSKGEKPPADYQNLVPIPFLTVRDTVFRFVISLDKIISEDSDKDVKLLDEAENYLKLALTEYTGIGAKTSLGYGFFREV